MADSRAMPDGKSSLGRDGETLDELTRELVSLLKQFYGKGPTKARTEWVGDDALVCLMGGGFTAAEQTLYEAGRADAVQDVRHAFQLAMEDRLREMVQQVTGRNVVAFLSAQHQRPDLIVEMFVLEPREGDTDSPVSAADQPSPEDDPQPG